MAELKDFEVLEISLVKDGAVMEDFLTLKKKNKEDDLMPDKKLVEKLQEKKDEKKIDDKNIEVLKEKDEVLKKLETEKEAVLKEKGELELKLKAFQDKETEAIFKDKANKYENLNGEGVELASILKEAEANLSKDNNKKLIELLDRVNAVVEKSSLFKELGGNSIDSDVDSLEKIEKIAKARSEKEKISYEKAFTEEINKNKDVYNK